MTGVHTSQKHTGTCTIVYVRCREASTRGTGTFTDMYKLYTVPGTIVPVMLMSILQHYCPRKYVQAGTLVLVAWKHSSLKVLQIVAIATGVSYFVPIFLCALVTQTCTTFYKNLGTIVLAHISR